MDKISNVWKWYEIVFLAVSFIALIACFFATNNTNYLSLISAIVTVFYVMTAAKGLYWSPLANIVCLVFYIWVSATQAFWGEVIRDAALLFPLAVVGCITWIKNRDKHNEQVVKVRNLSWQEYLYTLLAGIVGGVGVYFLLDALGTNQVILNTITFTLAVMATYLLYRRSRWYAILFLVNNIVTIVLWALTFDASGLEFLPIMLSYVINSLLNIYGLFMWRRNAHTQHKQSNIDRKARFERAKATKIAKNTPE